MSTTTDPQAITVNGEEQVLPEQGTLGALLAANGIDPEKARGVAVAVNDEVVPRTLWMATALRPGDRVEVVTAKQGG